MKNKIEPFVCTQPCGNCPYRTDAPKKLWAKEEFKDLLTRENSQFGAIYGCHKDNGSTCIGWLMNQDKNNIPSIALRISLTKNNVTREYLDSLHSPAPLYKSVKAMIKANYPEILKK